MQLSMKCSVAVHCLIFIHEAKGIARVTSPLLAESTGCNPVIIRNVISALKKAGLITVAKNIQSVLAAPYQKIENSIEETMESITLESMLQDFQNKTGQAY